MNLQSCHHYFSYALQSCSYLVIDLFDFVVFYHYGTIVPPLNLKWKLIVGSFTPSHVATSSHSFTILKFIKTTLPKFELELSQQEKFTKKSCMKLT